MADTSLSAMPKAKQPRFDLSKEQKQLIKGDQLNKKTWEEVMDSAKTEGKVRKARSIIIRGVAVAGTWLAFG